MGADIRVGSRPSLLARTQTELFLAQLAQRHPALSFEVVLITTEGDNSTTPLSEAKTPGVFVSALRNALLEKRVDFVVHSMKDLPSQPHDKISIACVPAREDPRDVLVSRDGLLLSELAPGSIVGTSSPRRAASIRALRPDLEIRTIRGNVDSRIQKVKDGEFDATVLAMAGLNRIGRAAEASEVFEAETMLPAPAQGALAVECRSNDLELIELLGALSDREALLTTTAERAVLLGLGASCATAIGAYAKISAGTLTLHAELAVESSGESVLLRRVLSPVLEDREALIQLGRSVAMEFLSHEIAERAQLL